ncbi:hypothetical protein BDD43_4668 [Mucilaginibacter gracilis]|uniref:Uncharacterized protein n=1 Tax=Mucilaginibacter gracilis TaxID=423350 RepID=A0A495J6T9_9SPHI|nr:hypothetical protein BDD43_4668 [Mucilaginibacter gracilis]
MAIFKEHNVTVKQLLGFIPEALIANFHLQPRSIITQSFCTAISCFICCSMVFWTMTGLASEALRTHSTIPSSRYFLTLMKMKRYAEVLFLKDYLK